MTNYGSTCLGCGKLVFTPEPRQFCRKCIRRIRHDIRIEQRKLAKRRPPAPRPLDPVAAKLAYDQACAQAEYSQGSGP